MSHLTLENMLGCLKEAHPQGGEWVEALTHYWDTTEMDALSKGCVKVGHCKNSRELIIGIISWIDLDYAKARFGNVCATAGKRGEAAIKGYARRGGAAPKNGYVAKGVEAKPSKIMAHAQQKLDAQKVTIRTVYQESAKEPLTLPTDTCEIWLEDFLYSEDDEQVWRAANGMVFYNNDGEPGELLGRWEGEDFIPI